jgi:hypothetical protein
MEVNLNCGTFGARRDEQVADSREGRNEPLKTSRGPETLHHPLPFSKWQMRILRPVIKSLVGPMFDAGHDLTPGRSIGAELVGGHTLRGPAS